MRYLIVLSAAVATFAGCKGDVTETTPSPGQTSGNKTANPTEQSSAPAPQTKPVGYASPQAAFAALQHAIEIEDLPTIVRCLDTESQEKLAVFGSLPLAMMALDPDNEKSINELLSKHGVSLEEDTGEFPIKTVEGRVAYITDVIEWLEKNADATGPSPFDKLADAALGEVTIDGDRAHATLTLADNQTDTMEFRRVDGHWFVHLPEPEFSSGPVTGSEGSDPFGEPGFGAFGGDDAPPPPIEAVPLEEFQSAWQVKLDEKEQPARRLLTKLAMQLGLDLKVDAGLESALQKPVSLESFEGSQWAAIEKIAREIDVKPVYTTSLIEFEPGRRELPVTFSGPFLIEMTLLETDPETATGQASVQAIAAGLPPAVVGLLNEGFGNPVNLTSVTDKDGNNLWRDAGTEGGGVMGFGGMTPNPTSFRREIIIGLKNLLRSVESINTLKGRIAFSLPTKVEVLKFDELKPGVQKQTGGVTLTLEQSSGSSVTFKYQGTDSDNIHLLAFDAQGKQVESFSTSSFGSGDAGQMSVDYQNAPARMEARIVTQQEDLEYEFRLDDIPIPNHSAMPEKLAELKFEGEAPVTVKYDSITGEENFRNVKFRVTNHANKDIESISMELAYLDENGKELKDFPTTHQGNVIPANGSADIKVTAFFMPEGTSSVKSTLKSVEFTDATRWKAPRR